MTLVNAARFDAVVTPVDTFLAAQRDRTAIERFSDRHDVGALDGVRWHAERLPASPPGPGQQYAFAIDLDACTGCKSCVAGCHSLNGLDTGESWRSVGLLVGHGGDAVPSTSPSSTSSSSTSSSSTLSPSSPRQQAVPSGCHHCVDPACLTGCPTNAYEKDPITGIVAHLDDQCFGCGYCTLMCPYEVPQMNDRLGIVRKCDLCADRLGVGEAPACVQACPTGAIEVTVVDTDAVVSEATRRALVPGAPASSTTGPTTRYRGGGGLLDAVDAATSADAHALHLGHSHLPLVAMLVLTQASVGAFLGGLLVGDRAPIAVVVAAVVLGVAALSASVTHLGRPLVAWRAVLGVAHSWLSREIVAFGLYVPAACAYLAASAAGAPWVLTVALGVGAVVAGIGGVISSVALYAVTRRVWWAWTRTGTKFAATTLMLGALVTLAGVSTPVAGEPSRGLVMALAVESALGAMAATISDAGAVLGRHPITSELGRTGRLLRRRLGVLTRVRAALTLGGAVLAPAITAIAVATATSDSADSAAPSIVAGLGAVLALVGCAVERYQYFVASSPARMPGGFRR